MPLLATLLRFAATEKNQQQADMLPAKHACLLLVDVIKPPVTFPP
jgi:hypothetical protein